MNRADAIEGAPTAIADSRTIATVGDSGKWPAGLTFLLVALAATAVIAPFWVVGNASGHDIQFHLSSWMDVVGQWREGIVYPRWAEWANWGFGEPRFVFYPPLSWILGAAIGLLLPWKAAPGAFVWLALMIAGMSMWRLAREYLAETEATTAAVLFAVNPYNLAMVYYRSDFAELLGVALLPLLLLGASWAIGCKWRRIPFVAVVFAAVWLCNAPEGVIATYSLALILLIAALRQRSIRPLLIGGTAMIAGFALIAFYLLPAARERGWVQISGALATNLLPEHNFLFTHSSDAEFQLFNWKISSIAAGTILTTGIAAAIAWPQRRTIGRIWWMLLGLGIASAFMMVPLSLPLWRHLPELSFLQFPWRWLGPLGVVFAFFAAAAIGGLRTLLWRRVSLVALLLALAVTGVLIARSTWWNSEDAALISTEIQSGHGYEGVDEYQPTGDDRTELPNATPDATEVPDVPRTPEVEAFDSDLAKVVPLPADVKVSVREWNSEHKTFAVEAAHPISLAVRLVNYPGWAVNVDGKNVSLESAPVTAQMLVPLPAGSHGVQINFRRTADRTAGDAISLVSAVGLAGFAFLQRRRDAARKASGA